MGLFQRMGGLISANLNDLIEHCEDPEKMLRQAVREMETALGQLMDGAARAIAHHKLLSRQLAEEREAIARTVKLAEEAVARNDDVAARRELVRKAEYARLVDTLETQVASADALGQRLRRQVTAMRLKLAEARRKLVDVSARKRAAAAQRKFVAHLPDQAGSRHAWSNFDALCARVAQSEAETEALLELLGESDNAAPFEAEVEAELRALKEAANHVTC
ncbi:MAG TPA: PspA/IM30 family protein [Lacipirellulaceae bacterium]|jgi:phage shock protein A|nr:PspA/IM30 family protein [Lacipirellulaceae bacterium]